MNSKQTNKHVVLPKQLRMQPAVLASIRETIGTRKAETGGILGGSRERGEVTHFVFDEAARERTGVAYTPNNAFLNNVLKTQWKPLGVEYLGSIHSHPPHYGQPSSGDEIYAKRILEALDLPYLLVPIVMTIADTGSFSLFPFVATHDGAGVKIVKQKLVVDGKEEALQEHSMLEKEVYGLSDNITWELLAVIGGASLLSFGIAKSIQRLREKEEGSK